MGVNSWLRCLGSPVLVLRHCLLREVELLELFGAGALTTVDQVGDLLLLLNLAAAVQGDELIEGQEAAADADDDSLLLDLHEDLLSVIAVDALRLSFEVHLAPDSDWGLVDVVGEALVDWVILQGLVDEQLVVYFLLELIDDVVEPLDLLVLDLAVLKQLHAGSLSLLAFLFDFEQLVRTLLVIALQLLALLVQRVHELIQFSNSRVLVFLLAEQLLELGHLAVDEQVLLGKSLDDLIFVLDVVVQTVVLTVYGGLLFHDATQFRLC